MTGDPLRLVSGGVAARPAVSENGLYVGEACANPSLAEGPARGKTDG